VAPGTLAAHAHHNTIHSPYLFAVCAAAVGGALLICLPFFICCVFGWWLAWHLLRSAPPPVVAIVAEKEGGTRHFGGRGRGGRTAATNAAGQHAAQTASRALPTPPAASRHFYFLFPCAATRLALSLLLWYEDVACLLSAALSSGASLLTACKLSANTYLLQASLLCVRIPAPVAWTLRALAHFHWRSSPRFAFALARYWHVVVFRLPAAGALFKAARRGGRGGAALRGSDICSRYGRE